MSKQVLFTAFIDGFLYLFGLSDNPIKGIEIEHFDNDNVSLSKDWENIGVELKKAFDDEKQIAISEEC